MDKALIGRGKSAMGCNEQNVEFAANRTLNLCRYSARQLRRWLNDWREIEDVRSETQRPTFIKLVLEPLARDLHRCTSMARQTAIDRNPGPLPQIRIDGRSVVFEFEEPHRKPQGRLVIRCDEDGNVLASIARDLPRKD
jgi:capsid protein